MSNDKSNPGWRWNNTFSGLPEHFFSRLAPQPVKDPQLVIFNNDLAQEIGLRGQALSAKQWAQFLSGNNLPTGTSPLAQAYAGHQFGHFTILGDGRAHLLGEHQSPGGQVLDIQLKGSGPTPWSRGGDGRAAMGPMLREYLISEAMHALGIPTTRSLGVVSTGEPVYREEPLPGAILCRVASSHLRIGTFEYFASQGREEDLRVLADYAIARHYPKAQEDKEPYLAFFRQVIHGQASLVARWMLVGFIHGVMNTDNTSISGQTIDYGPCAFMDEYDPGTVFSSIDRHGRYAWGNQPSIMLWNLARLGESLLPLFHKERDKSLALAEKELETFTPWFNTYWMGGLRNKLGLGDEKTMDFNSSLLPLSLPPEEEQIIEDFLKWMRFTKPDWTNTFLSLAQGENIPEPFCHNEEGQKWYQRWRKCLEKKNLDFSLVEERIKRMNPSLIPRNHKVETALRKGREKNDLNEYKKFLEALKKPYERPPRGRYYTDPPRDEERITATYCGT